MKCLFLTFAAVAALALLLASCNGQKKVIDDNDQQTTARQVDGQLVAFEYVEHGTMAQPNFEYRLNRNPDGKVMLYVFRPYGEGWGDTIQVSQEVVNHLAREISDNNLQNYKSHYSPPMQVLDGYSWRYSATYDNNRVLSSGGSNARPSDRTLNRMAQYLDSCYKAAKNLP